MGPVVRSSTAVGCTRRGCRGASACSPAMGRVPLRLPASLGALEEAVDAPSLQAFKARLDVALGSLGCWLLALHTAGGWNWMSTVVLSNPGHSLVL